MVVSAACLCRITCHIIFNRCKGLACKAMVKRTGILLYMTLTKCFTAGENLRLRVSMHDSRRELETAQEQISHLTEERDAARDDCARLTSRLHTHTHARARTRAHARTQAHSRARVHTHTHTHIHTCLHTHTQTHTLTHTQTHAHTHAPTLTHTNTHTHTRTYTRTQSNMFWVTVMLTGNSNVHFITVCWKE